MTNALHALQTLAIVVSTEEEGVVGNGSVLAERILANKEEILQSWEAAVRTLADAARAPQPMVRDQVGSFLSWLAERLADPSAPDEERNAFSHHHALERLEQGFDLLEFLAEMALLRECLLEMWESEPEGVTPQEIRRMNVEVDHMVAVCTIRYVQQAAETAGPQVAQVAVGLS